MEPDRPDLDDERMQFPLHFLLGVTLILAATLAAIRWFGKWPIAQVVLGIWLLVSSPLLLMWLFSWYRPRRQRIRLQAIRQERSNWREAIQKSKRTPHKGE